MKIPKGFRLLKKGEIIKRGDMYPSKLQGSWMPTTCFNMSWVCKEINPKERYIRRIKPRKKH